MDELIRELVHLGLSEKESAVYLAALGLGLASAQDISRRANVNRATSYLMIESLIARGLMSTAVNGKKRQYASATPDRLRSLLRLQRKELEEKEHELETALPMFMALFNVERSKPHVRHLEGPEGLETVRDMFLGLDGEFMQIVPVDDVAAIKEIAQGRDEHIAAFIAAKVPFRVIFVVKDYQTTNIPEIPYGEIRMVPADRFPIQGEITVRGNTLFLYSFQSAVLSVVVTSKEIADVVRALFNMAWEGAAAFPSKRGSHEPKSASNP